MSIIPYVGVTPTEFNVFPTQIYTPSMPASNILELDVPTGLWWRIIYMNCSFQTSATVSNRAMLVEFIDPKGVTRLQFFAQVVQPANVNYLYTFGPGLTTFSNVSVTAGGTTSSALPDILWSQGYQLRLRMTQPQTGDTFGNDGAFAIEVYSENYETGALTLLPTPLIP